MSLKESKKRKREGGPLTTDGAVADAGHVEKKKKKKKDQPPQKADNPVSENLEKSEDGTESKPAANHKYSSEEAAAWKKRKKFFQKKRMQQPKLFLLQSQPKMNGKHKSEEDASDASKLRLIKRREPVSLNEILYLLEYGLLGNCASFQPSWCKLLRVAKVAKVILIVLNGVTSRVYRRKRHCFPNIASRSVSTKIIPANSYFGMLQDILSHRKSGTRFDLHKHRIVRANQIEKAEKQSSKAANGPIQEGTSKGEGWAEENATPPPGKAHYLVDREGMVSRGYPTGEEEGFVHTRHAGGVSGESPLFGIDCEMVLTSAGSELTRVSLTDEEGKVLYNSLVKPDNPVRDYLTKYSGMTQALLAPIETRLADAQKALIEALPPDAILVGQGLENDLRALKIYHPHCVDTSNMFTGSERRVKLKLLAKEYLGRDIQCGTSGHDSVEDATAAMDLFKLKLAQGDKLRNYYQEYSKGPVFKARESIFQVAQELNKKTCAIDTRFTLKKFKKEPVSCVLCCNDGEICKKACSAVMGSDFVIMQLHGYNNLLQGSTVQDEAIETTLSLMDQRVGTVIAALPPNTLHVTVMPGSVETRDAATTDNAGKRGDYRTRHGRCVVGLKLEKITHPDDR